MGFEKLKDIEHKVFSVKHEIFYPQLEEWRKSLKPNQEAKYKECVYILTTDRPVPRVIKEDKKGILYIGKGLLTKNRERPGALINAVNGTSSNQHGGGNLYLPLAESKKYPIESLKLTLYFIDNPRDLEAQLLNEYHAVFGELPPLNSLF